MDHEWWAMGVDIDRPTAARMYDYYLGGANNFTSDREAAEAVIAQMPLLPAMAQANRAWLGRAVRYLVDQGVRQFLDIGSGIPTVGNVHEVAQRAAPEARVVYVDIDPVAVVHANHLLADNDRAAAVLGDLRRPRHLLNQVTGADLGTAIDLTQPTALLMVAVLPFVPGDDAFDLVRQLGERLAPGSYLAITHLTTGTFDAARVRAAQDIYQTRTTTPAGIRSPEEVARFFTGFDLVAPGLVWVPQWRPEPSDPDYFAIEPERCGMLSGVGLKSRQAFITQ